MEEILEDLRGLYSIVEAMEKSGEDVAALKANVQNMLNKHIHKERD